MLFVMEEKEKEQAKKILATSETWIYFDGFVFEDSYLIDEYIEKHSYTVITHNEEDDELLTPEETLEYIYKVTDIYTWERWEEEEEQNNKYEEYNGEPTQHDLDNEIYYKIVREGLGL